MFKKRMLIVAGWIVGIWLAVSCISYSSADSSWNTAGALAVHNWGGMAGAVVADLLWQGLGCMALLVPMAMIVWGIVAWRGGFVRRRMWIGLAVLVLGCWLCAGYEPFTESRFLKAGAGGFVGFYLGRWGVISVVWMRAALWGIWGLAAVYVFAVPVRRLAGWAVAMLPMLRRMMPVWQRAEKVVAPLKRVRVKKEKEAVKKAPVARAKSASVSVNPYQLPTVDLLAPAKVTGSTISKETMAQISRALEAVLAQFGISGRIVGAQPGPVVTLYEFEPASGVKTARVIALSDDIAREMRAVSVRIAVVPGSNVIGIEMPNPKRDTVYIRELIESPKFSAHTGALPLVLGKDIGGVATYADLAKMPHLLVAGTTGSGKSVAINTMILSLLYRFTPAECRLILVDPKMVELSVYNNIPHLLTPVVTEAPKAVVALKWAVREMEDRYRAMSRLGVRNIDGYNQKLLQAARDGQVLTRRVQTGFDEAGRPIMEEQALDLTPIPYIVMIVDEMSDLMGQCGKEAEPPILRLAQMARAVGIHLILATQRPSVDVITGLIKANFPTRISFQVTNKIDSRTILDEQGAEQLLGRGDMLYRPAGSKPLRLHGPFVSDEEVEKVVAFWRTQGEPQYLDAVVTEVDGDSGVGAGIGGAGISGGGADIGSGDLYDQAVAIVLRDRKVSTSYIQRQLRIGYNRAADLIDKMEAEGVISKPNIAGKREILVPTDSV